MEIKNLNGEILFEDKKANNIKEIIELAVKKEADLQGADLREADLQGADLRRADLRRADLRRADLREADLRRVDLRRVDLREADLREADLRKADLRRAYLRKADLREADLRRVDLQGAYLQGAYLPNYQIIPEEGSFIAWKKGSDDCIIKLQIPASAKRNSCLTGRKCRSSKAKVLNIWDNNGNKIKECFGYYRSEFKYIVGEMAIPDKYDPDIRVECSSGIHFFITRKEAENFV